MKNTKQMRILLLGSTGFIGLHLQKRFKELDREEIICPSSREMDLVNPSNVKKLRDLISTDTVLIMAAAITRERKDDIDSLNQNIAMVSNVAKAIAATLPRHCIYLSSVDIYGDPSDRLPITEETECRPNTYYGMSKLVGEFLMKDLCQKANTGLTILRFGGVYGSGNMHQHIVNNFLELAQKGKAIPIYGDGSDSRDYVMVDDLCQVIERCVSNRITGTFNVATGNSYSILQIAYFVNEFAEHKTEIRFEPRRRELFHYRFDTTKLVEAFGRLAFKDLREFIRDILSSRLAFDLKIN